MNPNARTLKYLRDDGWMATSVEKYMKFGNMEFGRRIDAFGFGDILACHGHGEIALVQACAGGDHNRRVKKLTGKTSEADLAKMTDKERLELAEVCKRVKKWKKAGGSVLVVSWAKRGARGERKLWTERVEVL